MLIVEECVLILLAAGRSARFGDVGSKLDQDFLGKPLGLHVAVALAAMLFRERIAVTGPLDLDYGRQGFTVLRNPDRDQGMATSVRLGIDRAVAAGAGSVLIALADMPRVTAAHIHRLFDASQGADTVVASSDGRDPRPPALFGAGRFATLLALEGDAGARDLVRGGRHVVASAAELVDIDTADDLAALRRLVRDPHAR